jgi:hypothetical protein
MGFSLIEVCVFLPDSFLLGLCASLKAVFF